MAIPKGLTQGPKPKAKVTKVKGTYKMVPMKLKPAKAKAAPTRVAEKKSMAAAKPAPRRFYGGESAPRRDALGNLHHDTKRSDGDHGRSNRKYGTKS